MKIAATTAIDIAHYRTAGATGIEERGKPFDLLVFIDGAERHIEVKGSVGIGLQDVQLTQGVVDHARRHQPTDHFVVDNIRAARDESDAVVTARGEIRIPNWSPDDRALRPTHLRYTLPRATT